MTQPYVPQTDQLTVLAQAIFDRLDTAENKALLANGTNQPTIFYGEQAQYPKVPAIAVNPLQKRRLDPPGAPRMYHVVLEVEVIIYLAKVLDSDQVVRKSVDAIGEKAEGILHASPTYGGLLIGSLVRQAQSGFAYKSGTTYRAYRMLFEGHAKKGLPLP